MGHGEPRLLNFIFLFCLTLSDARVPGEVKNNSSRPPEIHCVTRNSKTTSPSEKQIVVALCERRNKSSTPAGVISWETLLSSPTHSQLSRTQQARTSQSLPSSAQHQQQQQPTTRSSSTHFPGTFKSDPTQPHTEQSHGDNSSLNSEKTQTNTQIPHAAQARTLPPGSRTPEFLPAHALPARTLPARTLPARTNTTGAHTPPTFTAGPTARSRSVPSRQTARTYTSLGDAQGRTPQSHTSRPGNATNVSSLAPIVPITSSADSDITAADQSTSSDNTTPPLSLFTSRGNLTKPSEDTLTTRPDIFQTPTRTSTTAPWLHLFVAPILSYETFDVEIEEFEGVPGATNNSAAAQHQHASVCDVDACHHPQPPCRSSRHPGGCPCAAAPAAPATPRLLAIVPLSETEVTVRWCSPRSGVRAFAVAYRAVDGAPGAPAPPPPLLVHATWRSHVLRGLRPNGRYQVCVAAVGGPARGSCWRPERSFADAAATAEFTAPPATRWRFQAAIAAAFLLELSCVAVLSLCVYRGRRGRRCAKPPPPPPAVLVAYSSTEFLSVRNHAFLEIKDELAYLA